MESEDIIIGVCLRDIDLYIHPMEGLTYYGYICCAGKKLCPNEESTPYGEVCVMHDKIGVLLEFTDKNARLSFYRNSVIKNIKVEIDGCSFW